MIEYPNPDFDQTNLSQRTLAFLIRDDRVLLGYKKTGFGKGNWLGIGGKVEKDESLETAAIRELKEEILVESPELIKMAELFFYFPQKPTWSQQVHVFLVRSWKGEPQETVEIRPVWAKMRDLPFTQMWDDAKFWLPKILTGQKISGIFTFDNDLKVIKHELNENKNSLF